MFAARTGAREMIRQQRIVIYDEARIAFVKGLFDPPATDVPKRQINIRLTENLNLFEQRRNGVAPALVCEQPIILVVETVPIQAIGPPLGECARVWAIAND